MPLDVTRTQQYLKNSNFKSLFIEEMGWDHHTASFGVSCDDCTFNLNPVAQKRGLVVFTCSPSESGLIPNYPTRRSIERQVAKSFHEHLIIYTDKGKTTQIWQWVKREVGKPTACREHTYHNNQPGDSLIQKLQTIVFSLEEEEGLTIVDVAGRIRAGFNIDRITKRFYDRFKAEHDKFLNFTKGLPYKDLERWYVSIMLNRLMFIYFIQKKGFLDSNLNYLRDKLEDSQRRGNNLFYKELICPLFFEGFAKKENERKADISKLLGKVPFLNGGIFQLHHIEELHGESIQIEDSAFEKLFDFFDLYQWHLDERPLRADNEINPDVLGYIFEKYINQKQMGAYYTKEDITEYISKNTIIPYLFDAARQKCKIAFEGEQSVWRLLQADPDRYIYDAVKKGVELPLPPQIAVGLSNVSQRTEWNKPADDEYALPTEIWREVVARRQSFQEVRAKLSSGEIHEINDLITYNLNIPQFTQDVIENCEGPELLRAFWHAIVGRIPEKSHEHFENGITILDPTCGSGAFLFAALNILEPLYEACLDRMQVFLDELELSGEKHRPEKYNDFRKVLDRIKQHPNRRYFIFKSIIINNLFGVDIMEEATEICKLRLFLKLVAQVERVENIEPLPDIDFNIRTGNTLIGFVSREQIRQAITPAKHGQIKLFSDEETTTLNCLEENAGIVEHAFQRFHQMQTEYGMESQDFADAKRELHDRLERLEDELNRYLATEYSIDLKRKSAFHKWLSTHKPFHWFIEFYNIIKNGGFDVIIGNPPYVEYKTGSGQYTLMNFKTINCGDLYSYIMERSIYLVANHGRIGMIVPVSILSTDGFNDLRDFISKNNYISWSLSFAERPSKLFTGVEKRLTIWLMDKGTESGSIFLSNYRRWFAEEREFLFSNISFTLKAVGCDLVGTAIPKISSSLELKILARLKKQIRLDMYLRKHSPHIFYYTRKLRYFIQFFDFIPSITDSFGKLLEPSELKEIYVTSIAHKDLLISILNSNLFFWFFSAHSDVRNVNRREIEAFRCSLDLMNIDVVEDLRRLNESLMQDFQSNSKYITNNYGKFGVLTIQSFQPRLSKPVLDEIDRVLARHYGFSGEELDFLINYDIKYRMGKSVNGGEEE